MKYIKKVSAAQLISNTGTIIDSMNPGDDQTVNAPSIHSVKGYIDNILAGEDITITASTGVNVGFAVAKKFGKVCVINAKLVTTASKASGSTLCTFSENAKPDKNIFYVGFSTQSSGIWRGIIDQNRNFILSGALSSSVEVYFTLCYTSS